MTERPLPELESLLGRTASGHYYTVDNGDSRVLEVRGIAIFIKYRGITKYYACTGDSWYFGCLYLQQYGCSDSQISYMDDNN